jgi:hypothetical protein
MPAKLSQDEYIQRANQIHLNKYNYSKSIYLGMSKKILITCPIQDHGDFWQLASNHTVGKGCPKCQAEATSIRCRHSTGDFIRKAMLVHGDTYDYSKVKYIRDNKKVKIICKDHGIFEQVPRSHLVGNGCPKCAGFNSTFGDFLISAKSIHGDKYDYSLAEQKYVNTKIKIPIVCKIHNQKFTQSPALHLKGCGCPVCGNESTAEKKTLTTLDFVTRSKLIHNDFYDYSKTIYVLNKEEVIITCPEHGPFLQMPYNHLAGKGCPKCVGKISVEETEVFDFLISLGINANATNRKLIYPKELDIVLPDQKIAIEYNGLYWHSSAMSNFDKNSHFEKTNQCSKKGYRLIHIFSDDWKFKKEIIKSILRNAVNKTKEKVYARKCVCKKISNVTAKEFLNKNHLQGYVASSFHYGLFFENKLLQVMSFKKENANLNLSRFATKLNIQVVGGASKLFKYFCSNEEFDSVFTFVDLSIFSGVLYENLGFVKIKTIPIDYKYIYDGIRRHKFGFRRKRLQKMLPNFEEGKSELWNTANNGIFRIYDCGKDKYEYKHK